MANSYCLRCKAQTPTTAPKPVTMRNGAHAVRGTCGKCHGTKFAVVPKH